MSDMAILVRRDSAVSEIDVQRVQVPPVQVTQLAL